MQGGTPLFSRYRSSADGRPRRWCAGTRISPRSTWPPMPPTRKVTAQIRHNQRISAAQPDYKLSEVNEISGGQGQNRTADTRIFSPPNSVPSSTQEHLKQPTRHKRPLVRCSWVMVGHAGLGTKVETSARPQPGQLETFVEITQASGERSFDGCLRSAGTRLSNERARSDHRGDGLFL